jgi:hypothetical protein
VRIVEKLNHVRWLLNLWLEGLSLWGEGSQVLILLKLDFSQQSSARAPQRAPKR